MCHTLYSFSCDGNSTIFVLSIAGAQIASQATVETQSGWDQMEKDLKREVEDIRVSLLLLLLHIRFKPNIRVHKTKKISDLTYEMNYMKKKSTSEDHFLTKPFVVNYHREKGF